MIRSNNWKYLSIILLGISQSILAATLVGYNGESIEHSPSVALDSTALLAASWFDSSLPTVFYIHGYTELMTDNTVTNISSALYDVYGGKKNVIVLNWEEESSNAGLGREIGFLFHAIPGAVKIAAKLAELIVDLVNQGVNTDIHIIGHSLGAQLTGMCGAEAVDLGFTIPRLTGLDPAGPVFSLDLTNGHRLDSSDGVFVDIYHTDTGDQGIEANTGHVDVWFENFDTNQAGCETELTTTAQSLCSHQRSVFYFAESVRNSTAFYAGKADSYDAWKAGDTSSISVVGESIDTSIVGLYYLSVNSASPYGRGEAGATYSST